MSKAAGVGLFVARLHWTVSAGCLKRYFERFGSVVSSVVHIDVKTGMHKGYGWVKMSSEDEVSRVLEQRRHTIEGYDATVRRDEKRGGASSGVLQMEDKVPDNKMELPDTLLQQPTTS